MSEDLGCGPSMLKQSLVADIGGTRARFALVDAMGVLSRVSEFPIAAYPSPLAAIQAYLLAWKNPPLAFAVFAIAAPVDEKTESVTLTNGHWSFDGAVLRRALGLERLEFINDFTALAMALPVLSDDDLKQIGSGSSLSLATKAVIGPGTGLGVSGLIRCGNRWIALAGEGGHVTLAPADERESEILALARRELPHVSAERLVSGHGLPHLHRLVAIVDGRSASEMASAAIVEEALAGDLACRATINVFCALLGTVAGNLALTLGARGGLYVGGGIVPRLGVLFETSPFRSRFENKGRFKDFLADVPSYVILAPSPALLGAAQRLNI